MASRLTDLSSTKFLGRTLTIEIDRPLGSRHPEHGFIYPLNYGFLPGVTAGDDEPLDAYVLGVFEPTSSFEGQCIAVIQRLDQDDDKLILVPPGIEYSDEQIAALVEFQERFFRYQILRCPLE